HKRALEGDRGPNTGGMGAFSPVTSVGADAESSIIESILRRAAAALADEGLRYRGVLFAGLMVTSDGPKVLEFNCRFGDPETQVVLPRLASNFGDLITACVEGKLSGQLVEWTPGACAGVVLASEGYPGPVATGRPISGLDDAAAVAGGRVVHSGTGARDGRVLTSGGRVLSVTAVGRDLGDARERAYEACSRIEFAGMHYRRDIGELIQQGAQ
ncbi:MAG TPA: phosphoribosylglycinamide synthetase C domain-containing protein, partial [Actinomycetota bacterium]